MDLELKSESRASACGLANLHLGAMICMFAQIIYDWGLKKIVFFLSVLLLLQPADRAVVF